MTGERPNSEPAVRALGVATGPGGEILVDDHMRTSVLGVYAAGDVVGAPMEMFKARKCGMTAARNIMGEDYAFDFSEYPDFLHTTYEVTWVGLSEEEARASGADVVIIQMPPYVENLDTEHINASYDAGVLSVRVAGVYAGQEPKRIAVSSSGAVKGEVESGEQAES